MDLSLTAKLVWAAGFVLNVALLFVLLYKARFRLVPWFVIWIGFGVVYTAALFGGLSARFGPSLREVVLGRCVCGPAATNSSCV